MNHDVELEKQLLASAIHNKSALSILMSYTNLFYDTKNAELFNVMKEAYNFGGHLDYSILYLELQKRGKFEKLKDRYAEMATAYVSPFFQSVLDEVSNLAKKRLIAERTEKINKLSKERGSETSDLLSDIETLIKDTSRTEQTRFKGFHSVTMEDLQAPDSVWPTGFSGIDKLLCGFYGGQFIVIGARPGIGKSALALQFALNNCEKGKALLMSLEMPAHQIVLRKYTNLTEIPSWKIRSGKLSTAEQEMIAAAKKTVEKYKGLSIVDNAFTLDQIINAIRRHHDLYGKGLVILDYIQLVRVKGNLQRYLQIGEITGALKLLAMELDIPIIGLSQLSRGDENIAPKLSDLRESGNIEQDADVVGFIHRKMQESLTKFMIAKNREGPTNIFEMYFESKKIMFTELEGRF